MRLTIFALLVLATISAHCQSVAPPNPFSPRQAPPTFNWPGKDFSVVPPTWNGSTLPQRSAIVLPRSNPERKFTDSQIDPQFIIHPPESSLRTQPNGTFIAQNLYPGLQYLPIDSSRRKLENIPIVWPNLKIQSIPIVWPNVKLLPIKSQNSNSTTPPAK